MSEESRDYSPWQDPYHWRCGIFHLAPELDAYVDGFFDSREELALCQIVGHSYDLDAENMWDKIERIMRRVAEDDDILPMTHLDIVRYIRAMGQAVIEDHAVHNRSDRELWFFVNGESVAVQSGEKWEER